MTLGYSVRDKVGLAFPFTAQNNGNISWVAYRMSGVTLPYGATDYVGRAFTYDSTNRLLSAPFGCYYGSSWHSAGNRYAESYSYSDDGNFVKLGRHDSTSALIDSLNFNSYTTGTHQLTSYANSAGSGSTYTYDANGNVVSDSRSNIAFTIYDINNLPVAIYTTTGQSQVYAYDVNGSRVRKNASNGTDTYYLNDPTGKTELVQQGLNNSLYTYNIYGMDNIGQVVRNSPRLWRYYYLKDHLGSIRMIVNSSGGVDSYSDLYPYGLLMPGRSATTSADARYKFTGKERDVETNYDYFGARYYDARIGRWLSVDPMSRKYPQLSPYCYAANEPLLLIDPNGADLSTHTDAWGNVLQVYDDDDLGVYKHDDAQSASDIDKNHTKDNTSAGGKKMGETMTWDALDPGDKVLFGSKDADLAFGEAVKDIASNTRNMSKADGLEYYATNARNGGKFDLKHTAERNTATLLNGKYVRMREAGNILAGYVAGHFGMTKVETLTWFGSFQLNHNQFGVGMLYHYLFNPGPPYFGEDKQSSEYQALGWDQNK